MTIILFDEYGQYEINLPTDDASDVELDGHAMREYESAVAGIATQFLDMTTDPDHYQKGKQC